MQLIRKCGRRSLGPALILLTLSSVAGAQTERRPFHIPAAPISSALINLALQSEISIGHSGVQFGAAVSKPVDGELSVDEALGKLLAGTGFDHQFIDSHTVRILPRVVQDAPPKAAPAITDLVVVTATKRNEIAEMLPYPVSVVPGNLLQDTGAQTVSDLATQVPGMASTQLGMGQDKLFLRGLSDSIFSGRMQSVVGAYLDDAQLTDDAPDPGLKLVDIDRVEILRGPQGTLYGAGSLGGLVRIVTNKPVIDEYHTSASAYVAATESGAPSAGFNGVLNIPLVDDQLAMRAVAYTEDDGGYINDVRLHRDDVNQTKLAGGRMSLKWHPDERWSIIAGFTIQDIGSDDSQYTITPLQRANYVPEPHRDQFLQASLRAEVELDSAEIVSETATTGRHLSTQYDATLTWNALTGFPQNPARFNDVRNIQSISHETRVVSTNDGPWQWLSGLFYSHRDEDYGARFTGQNASSQTLSTRTEQRDDHFDEAAVFAEVTYHIDDHWSVTGGLRAFYSSLNVDAMLGNVATGAQRLAHGMNAKPDLIKKFVVSYQPEQTFTLYALASEGFRLGGVNIDGPAGINLGANDSDHPGTATFASDHLLDIEGGVKATWWDSRVITNGALFYEHWDNVQSDQILPDGSLYIINAGQVDLPGIEGDFTAEPWRNLRLTASASVGVPTITHANSLLVQTEGLLPAVPAGAGSVSARYDMELSDRMSGFASVAVNYVGQSHLGFDENRSPSMGDYALANLRLGVVLNRWQATVFVDNLANNRSNTFAFGNPFDFNRIRQIVPPRPRTIGLSVDWAAD